MKGKPVQLTATQYNKLREDVENPEYVLAEEREEFDIVEGGNQ